MKIRPFRIDPKYKDKIKKALISKIKITSLFGCWVWQGTVRNGYGSMSLPKGKSGWVHRVSYALFIGPIKEDHVIDHRCRNRLCVNPLHLRMCTHQDNCFAKHRRKLRERQKTIHELVR